MDYFLNGPRIGFRPWKSDDLPLALALWQDADVMQFLGGAYTTAYIEEKLVTEIAMQQQIGMQYWPMFQLSDAQHMGVAGLHPWNEEAGVYEVGVHVHRAFWSGRYGEEAARTVIAHAFDVHNAQSLVARHHPDNNASKSLIQRLGFEREGESYWDVTGLYHPTYRLKRP